jgi:hypothetical protein
MKFLENTNYSKIKDNLSVFIIIPALLGGIWQVVELASISTAFIRFFSVSQLVADGTLLLFLLGFAYAGLKIITIFFKENPTILNLKSYDVVIHKRTRNINIIIMIITGLIFYFILLPIFTETIETQQLSPSLFLAAIPMTLIVTVLFTSSLIAVIFSFGAKIKFKRGKSFSAFTKGMLGLLIIFILLEFSLFTITAFHKSFLLPENVKNLDYIHCKLGFNSEILYFNDKYIFIEYKLNNTSKIEILPFNSFLNNTACDSININVSKTN